MQSNDISINVSNRTTNLPTSHSTTSMHSLTCHLGTMLSAALLVHEQARFEGRDSDNLLPHLPCGSRYEGYTVDLQHDQKLTGRH